MANLIIFTYVCLITLTIIVHGSRINDEFFDEVRQLLVQKQDVIPEENEDNSQLVGFPCIQLGGAFLVTLSHFISIDIKTLIVLQSPKRLRVGQR